MPRSRRTSGHLQVAVIGPRHRFEGQSDLGSAPEAVQVLDGP